MKGKTLLFLAVTAVVWFSGMPAKADVTVTSETELIEALAGEETTILVSGNFVVSTEISISRNVVIKGVNSPVLTGGGGNRFANVTGGTLTIDGISFVGFNRTSGEGGCLLITTTNDVTIKNSRFLKCSVVNSTGGALQVKSTAGTGGATMTLTLINSVFSNCSNNGTSQNGYGGAINMSANNSLNHLLKAYNCTFANNTGGRYGGNHVSIENGPDATFSNCIFFGGDGGKNYANNDLLNIRVNSSSSIAEFVNCYIDSGTGYATSNTNNDITLTDADSYGGFYSGTLAAGKPLKWTSTGNNSAVRFTQPSTSVIGNIDGSAGDGILTSDYSLQTGSVAINASGTNATETDIRGLAAIDTRDLGAYEYGYSYVNVTVAEGVTTGETYPLYVLNGDHTITFTSASPMTASVTDAEGTTGVTPTSTGGNTYSILLSDLQGTSIEVTLAPAVGVTYTGIGDLTWINQLTQVPQGASITAKFEVPEGYFPRVAVISNGTTTYPSPTLVTGQAGVDTYSFTYLAGTAAIEFRAIDAINSANSVWLYVNGASGSDSNTGYESASPLKSFNMAVGMTEAVAAGSTINLTGNTDITAGVTISKALTLTGAAILNVNVGAANTAITIDTDEEVLIQGLTFQGNGSTSGKAITSSVAGTNYTIKNCKFDGLYTTTNGGVVIVNANKDTPNSSTTNIINCLFTNNTVNADWGGGALSANKGATVNIYNSTFYGNTSNMPGGQAMIANWNSAIINIYNSIVVGNGTEEANDFGGHNSSGTINVYSTIYGVAGLTNSIDEYSTAGINNITDLVVSTSDFTPKESSIAIGKSDNNATDADITGKAKVGVRDIGAYESEYADPFSTDLSGITVRDDVPVRCYNLQGVEVREPVKGNIYIVKQGAKVRKVMVR